MKFLEDFMKKNEHLVCLILSTILVVFILNTFFNREGFKEGAEGDDDDDDDDEDEGEDDEGEENGMFDSVNDVFDEKKEQEEEDEEIDNKFRETRDVLKDVIEKYNTHSHNTGMTSDGKIKSEYSIDF